MPFYYNNNERYGYCGPFDAESKDDLVSAMRPTFDEWADEKYTQFCDDGGDMDRDKFIAEAIAEMESEFYDALTEVDQRKEVQ